MPKFFVKKAAKETKVFQSHDDDSDPTRTFLVWTAPSRPYHKKDRSYYTTIAIIVILLVLIALIAQEILLTGVILALAFVTYVLAFIPPEDVTYKVSNQGITIGDHFYFWGEMDSFWFSQKEGNKIINILTRLRFPGQLIVLLGSQNEEQMKKIVARYLPFHEIAPKSLLDNWAESLQKHFPLENPHR